MRLFACAFVLTCVTFSAAAGAQRTSADEPASEPVQLRPFASKDQARRWRATANPRYPKGGVCLQNMACACSEPRDVEGACHGTTSVRPRSPASTACISATIRCTA